jgi:hypothetical protein
VRTSVCVYHCRGCAEKRKQLGRQVAEERDEERRGFLEAEARASACPDCAEKDKQIAEFEAREECFAEFMLRRGYMRRYHSAFKMRLEELEKALLSLGYEYEEFT